MKKTENKRKYFRKGDIIIYLFFTCIFIIMGILFERLEKELPSKAEIYVDSKLQYVFSLQKEKKDIFVDKHSFFCRYDLNIEKMNKAASYLLGEKDFSSFEKLGGGNATSICNIFEAHWSLYRPTHCQIMNSPYNDGDYIVFKIKANRFLRNMVRAIVGSLLEVGKGKKEPEWIKELIESHSRCAAGESVPGNALFFSGVEYPK